MGKGFNIRSWGGYYAVMYGVSALCTALFFLEVREWSAATWLLLLAALPFYAFFYTLPGALISLAAGAACRKRGRATTVAATVGGVLSAATQLLILADFGLFRNFGFHFNLFVWNLLTTPGGFASMGLRNDTVIPLTLAILLALGANLWAARQFCLRREGRYGEACYRAVLGSWRKYAWLAALALCGLVSATTFAWNHYVKDPVPLLAAERIPAYQRVTMRDIFRALKLKEPRREELLLRRSVSSGIDYPKRPIARNPERRRFNVVWLACESWRAEMLNPEVMPRTSGFAEKHGVNFKRHYSGGNGTRQGLFSMFYGLYGSYWHSFLASRTGAVLIDWMIEDGYDFGCFTSAKFSYPEFDQTIFSKLPAEVLHSDDRGVTYLRDERNTKRLIDFITRERGGRPFMAFMFFESPHYPYEFPEKSARFGDYAEMVNYLQLGPAQVRRIKNRYLNSCATLDGFLGEVLDTLEKNGLLENTVVVLIGDHGEEFFEHGRLGHNSDFSNEQTMTPLVLHLPGTKPGVYRKMSSHVDVTAMLAPYFGVENPSRDFTLGKNLLSPENPERTYSVIAGWDTIFFTGEKYKMLLPVNSSQAVTARLYDAQDRPLKDTQRFFLECRDELVEVQHDMRRFMK